MKFFNERSSKVNCFCNVFVSLLCTSYLFTGYSTHVIDGEAHHDNTARIVENDMEVVSQTGTKGKKVTKVTAVVTKKKVNTANKVYTPAKYNEVTGSAIVNYAKKYLGLRYVSGGNSLETGTDCSGFTKLIYKEFGVNLSRIVKSQVNNGSYIKKSDLQKGDLVFYGYGNGRVSHVAIYIGNGQVIHESNHRDGVKISSLNMMEYITARRVINQTANQIAAEKQDSSKQEQSNDVDTSIATNNSNTNSTNNDNIDTSTNPSDNGDSNTNINTDVSNTTDNVQQDNTNSSVENNTGSLNEEEKNEGEAPDNVEISTNSSNNDEGVTGTIDTSASSQESVYTSSEY